MRKLLGITALCFTLTAAALLSFGIKPAAAEGCAPRPSGAPEGWSCQLTELPKCDNGICQCNYLCTP